TSGAIPSFSPDGMHLLWHDPTTETAPGTVAVPSNIWISNVDGTERKLITKLPGGVSWLDNDRILITVREARSLRTDFEIYTISTGQAVLLFYATSVRATSIAPGGRYLMYYQTMQQDPTANGLYVIETKSGATPQKLPFFGSWRWR